MLLMLARHYTDAVLAGHNKATLPAVEAPTLNLAFCDFNERHVDRGSRTQSARSLSYQRR
jgi:hypothetical protein